MSALLPGLTEDQLFWLTTQMCRAEGYARGRYVESGDPAQRDLFEELLNVRLAAEAAYVMVTEGAVAQAQAHASRASALMAMRLRFAAVPPSAAHRRETDGGGDQ